MHFLDFISDSPKLFIFEREANKTNLGGVFCLIYLLIIITIFVWYYFDFKNKDEYTFSYSLIEDIVMPEEKEKRLNSEFFNPLVNISFDLKDNKGKSLDDRFIIFNIPDYNISERNKSYERHINNINLVIAFDCSPIDCDDFNKSSLKNIDFFYYLDVSYLGTAIDHYNKETPVIHNIIF